jgi:hypothetical protein
MDREACYRFKVVIDCTLKVLVQPESIEHTRKGPPLHSILMNELHTFGENELSVQEQ